MSSVDSKLFMPALLHLAAGLVCAVVLHAEDAKPATPAAIPDTNDGSTLYKTVCTACHGPRGEGNDLIKSPSIAGLPAWYARSQIASFREGRRGHDVKDTQGMLMAAIARMLKPEQIAAVSAHIESMPLVILAPSKADAKNDLQNGMFIWQDRCMECHRYNGTGELAFGSPPLIGLQDWYLISQIENFKNGRRGTAQGDVNGAKMVFSSSFIEDAQSLRDVVAYIMTLNPPAPPSGSSDPFEKANNAKKAKDATEEKINRHGE